MLKLILITILIGIAGLGLGGLIGVLVGGISNKTNAIILNFSAGTMISLVCFELVHEAIEAGLSSWIVAAIILVSAGIVAGLDYIVDERSGHKDDFIACEDCEASGMAPNRINTKMRTKAVVKKRSAGLQFMLAGLMTAVAVAIHNIPEGMSIGALYAQEGGLSSSLVVLLISIVIHNIPEGIAIAVSLTTSGMQKAKAVGIAALSGVPTVIGAIIGYLLGSSEDSMLPAAALSFAAGTLLYVVFGEILPQSINLYSSRKTAFSGIVGFAVGLIIIGSHMH